MRFSILKGSLYVNIPPPLPQPSEHLNFPNLLVQITAPWAKKPFKMPHPSAELEMPLASSSIFLVYILGGNWFSPRKVGNFSSYEQFDSPTRNEALFSPPPPPPPKKKCPRIYLSSSFQVYNRTFSYKK